MNIYLDIDGVIVNNAGGNSGPANYCIEFLEYITKYHQVFWLTSHCKNGGNRVMTHLASKLTPEALKLCVKVLANDWSNLKTDGINFSEDFRWIDDNAFIPELECLKQKNSLNKFIKVNLKENPNQLLDIIESLKV